VKARHGFSRATRTVNEQVGRHNIREDAGKETSHSLNLFESNVSMEYRFEDADAFSFREFLVVKVFWVNNHLSGGSREIGLVDDRFRACGKRWTGNLLRHAA